jgi:Domain of unknown function (DUF4185)
MSSARLPRGGLGRWMAVGAVAAALTAATAPPALAASTCAFDPAHAPTAAPDEAFDSLFRAYGDSNRSLDDWTGADTTNSVRLPDGRDAWIFSDTFLGRVNPDFSRSDPTFMHNSLVLQDARGQLPQTLHDGHYPHARSLVQTNDGREVEGDPPVGSDWYWLGDGTVEGDKLRVFALQFEKFGPAGFDFRWTGTAIATFSLPNLHLESVSPAPGTNGVEYGSSILEDGDYTYIYGTEDGGADKWMHVARVPRGHLVRPWEYFTGTGWSSDARQSARLLHGVGNEYSVTRVGDAYVLTTMDTNVAFSRDIDAYVSCSPTGPWGAPIKLYSAPDYAFENPNAFVYNAHAHPELTDDQGRLLISYNVNSFSFQDLMDDVHLYRARFVRVTLPPIVTTP